MCWSKQANSSLTYHPSFLSWSTTTLRSTSVIDVVTSSHFIWGAHVTRHRWQLHSHSVSCICTCTWSLAYTLVLILARPTAHANMLMVALSTGPHAQLDMSPMSTHTLYNRLHICAPRIACISPLMLDATLVHNVLLVGQHKWSCTHVRHRVTHSICLIIPCTHFTLIRIFSHISIRSIACISPRPSDAMRGCIATSCHWSIGLFRCPSWIFRTCIMTPTSLSHSFSPQCHAVEGGEGWVRDFFVDA